MEEKEAEKEADQFLRRSIQSVRFSVKQEADNQDNGNDMEDIDKDDNDADKVNADEKE